jgi:hypothetical protein
MELGEKEINLACKNTRKYLHCGGSHSCYLNNCGGSQHRIKDVKSFFIGLSNMWPWSIIVVIGVNSCVTQICICTVSDYMT